MHEISIGSPFVLQLDLKYRLGYRIRVTVLTEWILKFRVAERTSKAK